MVQKRREPAHGTSSRYRKGCRCDRCRSANSRAKRQERERARLRSGQGFLHIVNDVQPDPQSAPTEPERPPLHLAGPMEQAVETDLATVDPKDKPFFHTLKAAALALAKELDSIDSKSSKAPLVKQLVDVVKEIKGQEGAADDPALKLLRDIGVDPSGFATAPDRDET